MSCCSLMPLTMLVHWHKLTTAIMSIYWKWFGRCVHVKKTKCSIVLSDLSGWFTLTHATLSAFLCHHSMNCPLNRCRCANGVLVPVFNVSWAEIGQGWKWLEMKGLGIFLSECGTCNPVHWKCSDYWPLHLYSGHGGLDHENMLQQMCTFLRPFP